MEEENAPDMVYDPLLDPTQQKTCRGPTMTLALQKCTGGRLGMGGFKARGMAVLCRIIPHATQLKLCVTEST